MRIAITIPTYYRPRQLTTVISALHDTASGQHEYEFVVGVNTGDEGSLQALNALSVEVQIKIVCADPLPTLGEISNRLLRGIDADVYCWLADDIVPLAQYWDRRIEAVFRKYQLPAFCWTELNDSNNTTYPIISRALMNAIGPKMWAEWFPYWFIDTWLAEVYFFAFGERLAVCKDLPLGGKRGYTTGAHDLPYWFKFFAITRRDRITEAQRVADAFGLNIDVASVRRDAIDSCESWDAMQLRRIPTYIEHLAPSLKEPPSRYWIARARADAYLTNLDKAILCP